MAVVIAVIVLLVRTRAGAADAARPGQDGATDVAGEVAGRSGDVPSAAGRTSRATSTAAMPEADSMSMSSIIVSPAPGSRLATRAADALVRTVQRDLRVGERHG
jgi:hypothetical protein